MAWWNNLGNWIGNQARSAGQRIGALEQTAQMAGMAATMYGTGAIDWLQFGLGGPPKGPFPGMADLRKKFPQAGLPDRMVGTTIDATALHEPGATPDSLMTKAASLGFNTVRVGAYWDQIEPDGPGKNDFSQLDALLAAAKRHGLHVILTVGAKGPGWPEFHVPAWAKPDGQPDAAQDAKFRARSAAFVKAVARHEAHNPAICMWQVENEPFDDAGPTQQHLDAGMVADEAKILREADGHRRPLLVNVWSQGGRDRLDEAFRIADAVGLDVYNYCPVTVAGREVNPPGEWDRTTGMPSYALSLAKQSGKPAMITELQADNWGDYQANPHDVVALTHHLENLGYQNVLFWRLRQNVENDAKGNPGLDQAETQLARERPNARR